MGRLLAAFLTGLIPALVLAGCSGPAPKTDPTPEPGSSQPCLSDLPPEEREEVVASWIGGPLPADVYGTEDCDFYDFGWQSFLALTAQEAGGYVFTGWGNSEALFPESGTPPPYPGTEDRRLATRQLRKQISAALALPVPPTPAGESSSLMDIQQAGTLVPVVDQRGRWLQYSVSTNRTEYDFVRDLGLYASDCFAQWGGSRLGAVKYDPKGKAVSVDCSVATEACTPSDLFPSPLPAIPTGSVELKASWRVLETCDLPDSPSPCTPEDSSSYITVEGIASPYSPTVPEADVLLGLVGMHIISKTPDFQDLVWTTFEHQSTAPDCPGLPGDWILYGGDKNVNMFCTPCPIVLSAWPETFAKTAREQAANGQAVLSPDGTSLLCTGNPQAFALAIPPLYTPGTGAGQCSAAPIVTEVCREHPVEAAVQAVNNEVDPILATQAPVLSNYRLIGALWLDSWCGENPDCQQEGSLQLTNTSMETYIQEINCLVCHGENQFNPNPYATKPYAAGLADRSFLYHRIAEATLPVGTECLAPKPSYSCPACPDP